MQVSLFNIHIFYSKMKFFGGKKRDLSDKSRNGEDTKKI